MDIEDDLHRTTRELMEAAASVFMAANPKITNDEMARDLEKTLCMAEEVVSAKVEIVPEDKDERVVREVMEAPERFTINLQMVLRSPMPMMKAVYRVGEERISVGPIKESSEDT